MDELNIIDLVIKERERQKSLWGEKSDNLPYEWMSILGEEFGELCEAINESCFKKKKHKELGGKENIVKEAVQIAAVAIAIAEDALNEDFLSR